MKFLKDGISRWPAETLIYLDPPYYAKGRDLYYDFYEEKDHVSLAEFVTSDITKQRWIVSYDNVEPIRRLYKDSRHMVYDIGYSARKASQGSEVMFFCNGLQVPPLIGPVKITESHPNLFRRLA
jgi:DNA adenine methylase